MISIDALNELSTADFEILSDYLSNFAAPEIEIFGGSKVVVCYNCGGPLSGPLSMEHGSGFKAHTFYGAGSCFRCGCPGRSYHEVSELSTKRTFFKIGSLVLLYLPDQETD